MEPRIISMLHMWLEQKIIKKLKEIENIYVSILLSKRENQQSFINIQ